MASTTRRSFILSSALAAASATVLAACGTSGEASDGKLPAADSYPIKPDASGTKAKWSEEEKDGYNLITQEGGATLSYSPESGLGIIQVDGYAFKDLNGNGVLDLFEDWRQSPQDRATAWAKELSVDDELPLMLHSSVMVEEAKDLSAGGEMAVSNQFDLGVRTALSFATQGDGKSQSDWNNACQAYCEAKPNSIPFNLSTNP